VKATATSLPDVELEIFLDGVTDEIHLRAGLTAKTANTLYISIFQGITTRILQAEYQNFRIMLENNLATTELMVTAFTERDIELLRIIREETDEPGYTSEMSSAYGGGARLD